MNLDNVELASFSGWIDPPTDLQPALAEDITCDVAVIGGGVGGIATAKRLAERGQDAQALLSQTDEGHVQVGRPRGGVHRGADR